MSSFALCCFITGPPNGPALFCSLASVVVCNAASGPGEWASGHVAVGRRAGRVGGRVADTARWASTVTSH